MTARIAPPPRLAGWRSALFSMLLTVASLALPAALRAEAPSADLPNAETYLVSFAPGTPETERVAALASMQAELVRWHPTINVAEVRLVAAGTAIGGSSLSPYVTSVAPNIRVSGAYLPNDPHMLDPARSYAARAIGLPEAWNQSRGDEDIVIAVLDSGLALDHPEFTGRIKEGWDFVNSDDTPEDEHGHGTHVSGIIGAAIDNHAGIAGVCPNCSIMPVKVLDKTNSGSWVWVAEGIKYAVDNGARVINLSLGSNYLWEEGNDWIEYALERDVIVVAAAGNFGSSERFYPAAYEGVLGVAATTPDNSRWSLSNYGDFIDFAAPGQQIFSASPDMGNYYGGYAYMTGTSMASPFVAGLAGLLLSQDPERTAEATVELMRATASDLGASGRDDRYGHGLIQAGAALAAGAPDGGAVPPPDGDGDDEGRGGNDAPPCGAQHCLLYAPMIATP